MDSNFPNQPSPQPTTSSSGPQIGIPTIQPETPKNNKDGLFQSIAFLKVGIIQLVLVVIAVAFILAMLNYFKLINISSLFQRTKPLNNVTTKQSSNTVITPTNIPPSDLSQQAQQTLVILLPTILSSSLVPQSLSSIAFKQNEGIKESFSATWYIKEGTVSAIMVSSTDTNNISQMYLSFLKTQNQVPTETLAQTTTSEFFLIQPKGKWGCQPIYENTSTFCENFWEEENGVRFGVGIIGSSSQKNHLVFLCLHNQDSKLYSWKSCQNEFAETGVNQLTNQLSKVSLCESNILTKKFSLTMKHNL